MNGPKTCTFQMGTSNEIEPVHICRLRDPNELPNVSLCQKMTEESTFQEDIKCPPLLFQDPT